MAKLPRGWQRAGYAEPPAGADLLVFNGKMSVARFQRGEWVAYSDGIEVLDPWEKPVRLQGVTHWRLPDVPKPEKPE